MTDATQKIADKVRGLAGEKHLNQQDIATLLGIDRKSVHARWHGRVPFSAAEVFTLAESLNEPVTRFFPEPAAKATAA